MQAEKIDSGVNQPELSPSGRTFSWHPELNQRLTDIYRESIYFGDHRVQLKEAVDIFGFGRNNNKVAKLLRPIVKTANGFGLFNTPLREDNSDIFHFTSEQLMLLRVLVEVRAQGIPWSNIPYVARYLLEDEKLVNELGRPCFPYNGKRIISKKTRSYIENLRKETCSLLLPEGELGSLDRETILSRIPESFLAENDPKFDYDFTKKQSLRMERLQEIRREISGILRVRSMDSVNGVTLKDTDVEISELDTVLQYARQIDGNGNVSLDVTEVTFWNIAKILDNLIARREDIVVESVAGDPKNRRLYAFEGVKRSS